MKVLSDAVKEELPTIILVIDETCTFNGASHGVDNVVNVFSWEEVSDFTRGQQIIDGHEETLVSDLTLSEEEHDTFIFLTSLEVHLLEIHLKVSETVT